MGNKKTKGNLFQADISMAHRVADYIRIKIYNVCWETRYKADVRKIQDKIDKAPELLKGSIFADQLPELIKQYEDELVAAKKKLADKKAENDTFTFSEGDLAVYNAYKKGEDMTKALTTWFEAYHMPVENTKLLDDLLDAISGKRQATNRTIVNSGAMQFTDIRSKNDVLRTLYCELATKMLEAGTLKPEWLPSDIVAFYAPKNKKSK